MRKPIITHEQLTKTTGTPKPTATPSVLYGAGHGIPQTNFWQHPEQEGHGEKMCLRNHGGVGDTDMKVEGGYERIRSEVKCMKQ